MPYCDRCYTHIEGEEIFMMRQEIYPPMWDDKESQGRFRKHCRERIAIQLMEEGWIPTSVPSERIYRERNSLGYGIDTMILEIRIQVRKAPPFHFVIYPHGGDPYPYPSLRSGLVRAGRAGTAPVRR